MGIVGAKEAEVLDEIRSAFRSSTRYLIVWVEK